VTLSRRRAILASALAFFGLGHKSVRGATSGAHTGFLDLNNAVSFPTSVLNERWDIVTFEATLSTPKGDKRLQGALLKTGDDVEGIGDVRAFCTICPHEICHVEFFQETERFRAISDAISGQPLFVCPCHFSVFDPIAEGEAIGGPAPRGLYAFAFEVTDNEIRVTGIEAGVLELLS